MLCNASQTAVSRVTSVVAPVALACGFLLGLLENLGPNTLGLPAAQGQPRKPIVYPNTNSILRSQSGSTSPQSSQPIPTAGTAPDSSSIEDRFTQLRDRLDLHTGSQSRSYQFGGDRPPSGQAPNQGAGRQGHTSPKSMKDLGPTRGLDLDAKLAPGSVPWPAQANQSLLRSAAEQVSEDKFGDELLRQLFPDAFRELPTSEIRIRGVTGSQQLNAQERAYLKNTLLNDLPTAQQLVEGLTPPSSVKPTSLRLRPIAAKKPANASAALRSSPPDIQQTTHKTLGNRWNSSASRSVERQRATSAPAASGRPTNQQATPSQPANRQPTAHQPAPLPLGDHPAEALRLTPTGPNASSTDRSTPPNRSAPQKPAVSRDGPRQWRSPPGPSDLKTSVRPDRAQQGPFPGMLAETQAFGIWRCRPVSEAAPVGPGVFRPHWSGPGVSGPGVSGPGVSGWGSRRRRLPSEGTSRLGTSRLGTSRPNSSGSVGTTTKLVGAEIIEETETASFNQIEAGKTTAKQLNELWDPPKEVQTIQGVERRVYRMEHFDRVMVDLQDGLVRAVMVTLEEPVQASVLARDLNMDDLPAVVVTSREGELLGQAYPERGVLFTYSPDSNDVSRPLVKQIVLEAVQPEPFVLRAEANLHRDLEQAMADVQQALAMAPDYVRAHWVHAQLIAAQGDVTASLKMLNQVIAQDPKKALYRITRAELRQHIGDLEGAVGDLEEAVNNAQDEPLLQARAFGQLGDLVASKPQPDYRQAMTYHQQALKLTQPLMSTDRPLGTRMAAQEVLVDAYLGIAGDIAWGSWNGKAKAVPKWLEQARVVIQSPGVPQEMQAPYRFHLASKALWAYVGMQEPLPDDTWPKMALTTGKELLASTEDPVQQGQIAWQLGASLHDAQQVYLLDSDFEQAGWYGRKAAEYLEQGYQHQGVSPTADHLLGRCYFCLGSVYALGEQDYLKAADWYTQAMPLLTNGDPSGAAADLGHQGETFVSMGVAFWKVDQKQRAVQTTEQGLELIRKAVDNGELSQEALKVPYRNLANMYKALGNTVQAKTYKQLAEELTKVSQDQSSQDQNSQDQSSQNQSSQDQRPKKQGPKEQDLND